MGRFLTALKKRGITARQLRGGRIEFIPPDRITPSMAATIRANIKTILAELRAETAPHRADALIDAIRDKRAIRLFELDPFAQAALRDDDPVTDPRPDLAEDSELWTRLLALAGRTELGGALHGFRCQGARLTVSMTGAHIEPGDGWESRRAFDADRRKWLGWDSDFNARRDAPITALLRALPRDLISNGESR